MIATACMAVLILAQGPARPRREVVPLMPIRGTMLPNNGIWRQSATLTGIRRAAEAAPLDRARMLADIRMAADAAKSSRIGNAEIDAAVLRGLTAAYLLTFHVGLTQQERDALDRMDRSVSSFRLVEVEQELIRARLLTGGVFGANRAANYKALKKIRDQEPKNVYVQNHICLMAHMGGDWPGDSKPGPQLRDFSQEIARLERLLPGDWRPKMFRHLLALAVATCVGSISRLEAAVRALKADLPLVPAPFRPHFERKLKYQTALLAISRREGIPKSVIDPELRAKALRGERLP